MNEKPVTPLNIEEQASLLEWSNWLNVTGDVLTSAASRVGTMPAALQFYLAERKPRRRRKTQEERAALEVRKIAQTAPRRANRPDQ